MMDLVRSGRRPEEPSREFGPTALSIWNRVGQAGRDGSVRKDAGAISPEREELTKLRRENHRLRQERDILAKALASSAARRTARERTPSGSCRFPHRHHGPRPGRLALRLLRMAQPPGFGAGHDRCGAAAPDQHDPHRVAGRGHSRCSQAGGTVDARGGAGLRGVSRRRFPTTTQREPGHRCANDLVGRDFRAAGPNRLWVADITYVPTAAGFLLLAVVLDVWSRRIVGWAMATDLRTRLVLDALGMAVTTRKPADVVHHSDQGSQYTSVAFGFRCREAGVRPSNTKPEPWPRRSDPYPLPSTEAGQLQLHNALAPR